MPWEVVEVVDPFELTSRNVWKFEKKKKKTDGQLGNGDIYKESRRRVGNENRGDVISGVGGEPGRGMKASVGGVTEDKERVPRSQWAVGHILNSKCLLD